MKNTGITTVSKKLAKNILSTEKTFKIISLDYLRDLVKEHLLSIKTHR